MKQIVFKIISLIIFATILMPGSVEAVYENYVNNILQPVAITSETQSIQQELEAKVQEMVSAGHMAPTLYFIGLGSYPFRGVPHVFYNTPAETIYTLSAAYPYLSDSLKTQLKTYLDNEIKTYPPHQQKYYYGPNNGERSDLTGAQREYFTPNPNASFIYNWEPGTPLFLPVLYVVWLYSNNTGDWTYVVNNYSSLRNIYTNFKASGSITSYPELAGVIGFARIAQRQGNTADYNDALAFADQGFAVGLNFNQFLTTANTNFPTVGGYTTPIFMFHRNPVAMHFNKDIGLFLKDNTASTVVAYSDQILKDVPLGWQIAGSMNQGENLYSTPEIPWTYFMLRSYVLGDTVSQLKTYLDAPDRKGDLLYMQKLVATIEATPSSTQPCTLTSASWSTNTVTEGSSVGLNVSGSGNCTGQTVNLEVRRYGSTPLDDIPANIQPNPVTLNTGGSGTGTWIAEFTPLIPGTNPDYYFKAILTGGNTIDNKANLLTVTQAVTPTPTPTPTPTVVPTTTPTPTPTPTVAPTATPIATPTPTPISSPTPTPTPGPCTLNSASWNTATAVVNSSVGLNITASGNCSGNQVNFEVRRNIALQPDQPAQNPPSPNPVTLTQSGTNFTAASSWIAEWLNACTVGTCDPEYFFKANIVGQTSTIESNPRLLTVVQSAPIVNLLTNGDFETGTPAPWQDVTASAVVSDPEAVHSGSFGVHLTSSQAPMQRWISVTPGKTYVFSGWYKWKAFSGSEWGFETFSVGNSNWQIEARIVQMSQSYERDKWHKLAVTFTAQTNAVEIGFGVFGPKSTVDLYFDDFMFFEKNGNLTPTISPVAGTSSGAIPATVNFQSNADDLDGAIAYYLWDFGDGGKSNLADPSYAYANPGDYTVKLTVIDNEGASASKTIPVSIIDLTYPTVSVTNPPTQTNQPTVALSGTATGNIISVVWSSDRGGTGGASGTSSWTATIPLQGGKNRILINARDSSGKVGSKDLVVWYRPSQPVSISTITPASTTIEQYEKFELTFPISNSVATNPNFPYETNPPSGIESKIGMTVNGEFSQDNFSTKIVQPGFIYQDFDRKKGSPVGLNSLQWAEWVYPKDAPVWKIRFAPPRLGNWQYRIVVQDDSGSATSATGSFTAVAPTDPNNHGFIQVSKKDSRYFEFSDGTPFVALGPGAYMGSDGYLFEDQLAKIGTGSANLARTWLGGNIYGSAWNPWMVNLPYRGNVPATSLTTEQVYGDGLFSVKMEAGGNRCMSQAGSALKLNSRYQVSVRAKLVGVDSAINSAQPFGLIVRRATYPYTGCDTWVGSPVSQQNTPIILHQKGTSDWQVLTGEFVNTSANSPFSNTDFTQFLHVILENAASGTAYIDELSLREVLANGTLGEEILRKPKMNFQSYFDQNRSFLWDNALDKAKIYGLYFKPVISEKDDEILNAIAPAGFADSTRGYFDTLSGATLRYQEYYWRYLTARYGYSRNIHSWELANEQGPGNIGHANALASYIHQIDPNRHMATTSFWCCYDPSWWNAPSEVDYADIHTYISTGWFSPNDIDPVTGGNIINDSALYTQAYSMDIYNRSTKLTKPIIRGEAGIDSVSSQNEDPALAQDTQGIWFHKYTWGQINPGGLMELYWWDQNIKSQPGPDGNTNNGLFEVLTPYTKFMNGIPISNGNYRDASATVSDTNLRAWGQKDTTLGRAHLWIDNKNHTWRNVVNGVAVTPVSGAITFSGMPAGSYDVSWFDTYNGTVSKTEVVSADASGNITLTLPQALSTDIAVKVENQNIPTQPCSLTTASWSTNTITQGSSVGLNVSGSGNCSGQSVNLEVRRNGLIVGVDDIPANIQPNPITLNTAGSGTSSWIAEFTPLIPGTNAQYYFKATVSGGNTIDNKTALLTVTQAITPTPTPTPTVAPTATPTPGPISGNDWPQVQRDANHSGYVPQTVGPPYTELWRWTAAPVSIRVQPIIAQGLVFMPSNDGKLYAINKDTGLNSWVFDTGSGKPLVASAAYDSGVVFFGSTDGHIYAVDVGTRTQRWKYPTTDKIGSIRSAPIVANNTVFIGSSDGKMYALDTSSGTLKWSYDIGAPILDTAAYYNGMIYFGGMDSKGYALDANTGSLVWSKQLYGQGFRDRWTVAGNGKVIFTTMPYYPPVTRLGDQGTAFLHNLWSQGINDWPTQRNAIRNLFQNDPFLRSTYVLDATSGAETNIAPILYISGGSTSAPSQPVLLPNGDVNVIYRWTAGIEPLSGQTTNSAIFLGQMDLGTGDITQLDDRGTTDPYSFDITKHIAFISDESSALMRSGDIIYIDSSRGTVGFDLNTKQVLPFSSYVTFTGGVYLNPPIIFYKNTTSSIDWYSAISVWPNAEQWSSGNDFKRPTPLADDVFYMFHYNTLIAVKGIKR